MFEVTLLKFVRYARGLKMLTLMFFRTSELQLRGHKLKLVEPRARLD